MLIIILLIILIILIYLKYNKIENFQNTNPKYNLAIMAIFKDEEDYLQEWLNHHIKQGISHFYLFCNDPNLNKYYYLPKYTNYITIIPWTDKKNNGIDSIQRQAYHHCVQNYSNNCNYLLMLDIDEFIIPKTKNKTVIEIINILPQFQAIKIPRFNFGSDGHIHKPKGLVMNNYFNKENICSSFKTIANTKYLDKNSKFFGVHDFPFIKNNEKIYNNYFDYKYSSQDNGCTKNTINEVELEIYHYYSKSYDEYMKRCQLWKNGGVNIFGFRKDCEKTFFEKDRLININNNL
jgi:hypothetical protein